MPQLDASLCWSPLFCHTLMAKPTWNGSALALPLPDAADVCARRRRPLLGAASAISQERACANQGEPASRRQLPQGGAAASARPLRKRRRRVHWRP